MLISIPMLNQMVHVLAPVEARSAYHETAVEEGGQEGDPSESEVVISVMLDLPRSCGSARFLVI